MHTLKIIGDVFAGLDLLFLALAIWLLGWKGIVYWTMQQVTWLAFFAGLPIIGIASYRHAWTDPPDLPSIKPLTGRKFVDQWVWKWMNFFYGNPEDGVSGKQALIWSGGQLVPYMASASDAKRAFFWSALRNNCGGLKYEFAWADSPLYYKTFTLFGQQRTFKMGWQSENGFDVPVFSV